MYDDVVVVMAVIVVVVVAEQLSRAGVLGGRSRLSIHQLPSAVIEL